MWAFLYHATKVLFMISYFKFPFTTFLYEIEEFLVSSKASKIETCIKIIPYIYIYMYIFESGQVACNLFSVCLFSSFYSTPSFWMTLGRLPCLALDRVTPATPHHQDNHEHYRAYEECTESTPLTGFTHRTLSDKCLLSYTLMLFVFVLYQLLLSWRQGWPSKSPNVSMTS